MLAGAAWNSAVGDIVMLYQHRKLIEQFDWSGTTLWAELRSDDTDKLIGELAGYKRKRYPDDHRRIVATEMSAEGNVRVRWTEPKKNGGHGRRRIRYEHNMKYGPARDYWSEFVFEAYINHRTAVIFLAGLPDVGESRPHSRVNNQ